MGHPKCHFWTCFKNKLLLNRMLFQIKSYVISNLHNLKALIKITFYKIECLIVETIVENFKN
jgi:hypothetical protein